MAVIVGIGDIKYDLWDAGQDLAAGLGEQSRARDGSGAINF